MRKKINITVGVILIVMFGMAACEQYNYDPPKYEFDPAKPDISYSETVAPLFVDYKCTDCHTGTAPVLTAGESYQSLTATQGRYINLGDAEESLVVKKIEDPEHGGTWDTEDLWTLLDWINQGAKDN